MSSLVRMLAATAALQSWDETQPWVVGLSCVHEAKGVTEDCGVLSLRVALSSFPEFKRLLVFLMNALNRLMPAAVLS